MNKERTEWCGEIETLEKGIDALNARLRDLRQRRAEHYSLCKIGDRIRKLGIKNEEIYEIVKITPWDWGEGYRLWVRRIKKDGEFGKTTREAWWDYEPA